MVMRQEPTIHRLTALLGMILMFAIVVSLVDVVDSAERKRRGMTKKDKCPVCGMFVYKYPKWVAVIELADGTSYFYDGAKDMFKHYMNVSKYTPSKAGQDIVSLEVTDYYAVSLIDAKEAWYVIAATTPHAWAEAGSVDLIGSPLAQMSASPATIRRAPPMLGEHNAEVLAELGYDEARLAELKAAGII